MMSTKWKGHSILMTSIGIGNDKIDTIHEMSTPELGFDPYNDDESVYDLLDSISEQLTKSEKKSLSIKEYYWRYSFDSDVWTLHCEWSIDSKPVVEFNTNAYAILMEEELIRVSQSLRDVYTRAGLNNAVIKP